MPPTARRAVACGVALAPALLFAIALCLPLLAFSCSGTTKERTGFEVAQGGVFDVTEGVAAKFTTKPREASGNVLLPASAIGIALAPLVVLGAAGVALRRPRKGVAHALTASGLLGALSLSLLCLAMGLIVKDTGTRDYVSIVPRDGFYVFIAACFTCFLGAAAIRLWIVDQAERAGAARALVPTVVFAIATWIAPTTLVGGLKNSSVAMAPAAATETESGMKAEEILAALPAEERELYCVIDTEVEYFPGDEFRVGAAPGQSPRWGDVDRSGCFRNAVRVGLFVSKGTRKQCDLENRFGCVSEVEFSRWSPAARPQELRMLARFQRSDGRLSGGGPAFPCYVAKGVSITSSAVVAADDEHAARALRSMSGNLPVERLEVAVRYEPTDLGRELFAACPRQGDAQPIFVVDGYPRRVGTGPIGDLRLRAYARKLGERFEIAFERPAPGAKGAGTLVTIVIAEPVQVEPPPPFPLHAPEPAAPPGPSPMRTRFWELSEVAGAKRARAEKRPLLVHFVAGGCTACDDLTTKTFQDPKVLERLAGFVNVKVDVTLNTAEDMETKAKYAAFDLPVTILFDSAGVERVRLEKFVSADEFLTLIRGVR